MPPVDPKPRALRKLLHSHAALVRLIVAGEREEEMAVAAGRRGRILKRSRHGRRHVFRKHARLYDRGKHRGKLPLPLGSMRPQSAAAEEAAAMPLPRRRMRHLMEEGRQKRIRIEVGIDGNPVWSQRSRWRPVVAELRPPGPHHTKVDRKTVEQPRDMVHGRHGQVRPHDLGGDERGGPRHRVTPGTTTDGTASGSTAWVAK